MRQRLRQFFNPPHSAAQVAGPRAPVRLFWTAFLVRVLYMTLAHTYRIRPAEDHFQFGWEAGRIARALVTGYGYADPFANAYAAHTGPTAWLPPLYPLLMAAIFKLFGIYTLTSAWILFTINSAASAATALATYEIAARCFNRRVALWSGWVWALYPAAMQYAVRWPWEMSITTCLFTWTLVLALRMRGPTSNREPRTSDLPRWLLFALLWALIALSNSTLLLFLPICALWMIHPTWGNLPLRRKTARNATLAALLFLACLAPWTYRNWRVFHTFIPLRGNLGAELDMGNGPGSDGLLMEYLHPFQAPEQLRLYRTLGEPRYVALRGTQAEAYIAARPAHFAADTLERAYFFWFGVPHPSDEAWYNELGRTLNFAAISLIGLFGLACALHRRAPAAGLFASAFLLLPLPYYAITVHARFRHPLEPLICILGVYLFQSAVTRRAPRSIA